MIYYNGVIYYDPPLRSPLADKGSRKWVYRAQAYEGDKIRSWRSLRFGGNATYYDPPLRSPLARAPS